MGVRRTGVRVMPARPRIIRDGIFSVVAGGLLLCLLAWAGCSGEGDGASGPETRVGSDLEGNDPVLIQAALRKVELEARREHLPRIRILAREGTPAQRLAALGIMREFQDRSGVEVFLAAAREDSNENIRVRAYKALADLGDFTVFSGVVEGLRDPDRASKLGAAYVLERLRLIEGVPVLLEQWALTGDVSLITGFRRALEEGSGLAFGDDLAAWRRWWGGDPGDLP